MLSWLCGSAPEAKQKHIVGPKTARSKHYAAMRVGRAPKERIAFATDMLHVPGRSACNLRDVAALLIIIIEPTSIAKVRIGQSYRCHALISDDEHQQCPHIAVIYVDEGRFCTHELSREEIARPG